MSLSGARNFEFDAVSDFTAHLSFIIKENIIENKKMREIEEEMLAKKINKGRVFEPKINDPLEDVIERIEKPEPEHKKTTFPYVEPTVQLPDEIGDFTDLLSKIYKVNGVATEQKKQKDIEDVIESIIKDPILSNEYWDDIFSKTDTQPTIDATKIIVDDIKQTTNNALQYRYTGHFRQYFKKFMTFQQQKHTTTDWRRFHSYWQQNTTGAGWWWQVFKFRKG